MFKAVFDYFPVGPVVVALVIFILLPFDKADALAANNYQRGFFSAVAGLE